MTPTILGKASSPKKETTRRKQKNNNWQFLKENNDCVAVFSFTLRYSMSEVNNNYKNR